MITTPLLEPDKKKIDVDPPGRSTEESQAHRSRPAVPDRVLRSTASGRYLLGGRAGLPPPNSATCSTPWPLDADPPVLQHPPDARALPASDHGDRFASRKRELSKISPRARKSDLTSPMTPERNQPFWTSVILHLVVLLGVFLATIVQAFKPKERPCFRDGQPARRCPDNPRPRMRRARAEHSRGRPLEPLPEIGTSTPAPSPPPTEPPPRRAPEPAPRRPKTHDLRGFLKQDPIKEPAQRQTHRRAGTSTSLKIDVPGSSCREPPPRIPAAGNRPSRT